MEINKDVFIQQGILDCQIDQLISFSQTDEEVKKDTSDASRFKDRHSFDQWLEQGKIIYTLTDKNNNLLGIIWFGQKKPPIESDTNFTFAIRVYPPARGQGLSFDFIKFVFDDLLKSKHKSEINGFWLQVSPDNFAAIRTYEKFGFKKVDQKNNKIIMVLNI